ncbi:ankyrin repeat containing protein yar1 [Niveomyces insectorum RCEF 264]|uniref:Ankyrin repeat containing protein yar1 n=1 Tax=Niveomyces insectorum RCEF 264 TaxID=1081102 RepID=A0A167S490_9HYPO|nr:ankyrin repeat containing protein yar1 [Niveomyces insectorum RCEF 264]
MAPPQLTEDEVDDLLYFARAGEEDDLAEALGAAVRRAGDDATPLAVLAAATDAGRNTPLHMAAANGHTAVVQYLLDQVGKADRADEPAHNAVDTPAADPSTSPRQRFLDAANAYGNTALHWAAMNGHLDVVRLLVRRGAAPALANDKNYVPLDLAGLQDHGAVVDYFLAAAEEAESGGGDGDGDQTGNGSSKATTADKLGRAAAALDLDGTDTEETPEAVGEAADGKVA